MSLEYENAYLYAHMAHDGQMDKGGHEYIEHLVAVAGGVEDELKVPALLHDILEDTNITYSELKDEFGVECADIVMILTRNEGESYEEYIRRVGLVRDAAIIKMADLKHNMDFTRLPKLTVKDFERVQKYHTAYKYLEKIVG